MTPFLSPPLPASLPAGGGGRRLVLGLGLLLLSLLSCARPGPGVLLAYVAVAGNNHVQVVDLATGKTLRKIYSGATPWRLIPSPDGKALWVQHWSPGTTAVVDLESHEIVRVLPVRGPGAFSADGRRFLTFDWPGSALDAVDARTFKREEERVTEIPRVYDLALGREGKNLYLVQFDPMARGPRERFAYALSYPLNVKDPSLATPISYRTGRSPVAVKVLRKNPFLLTADRETNGLTLLNELGDGRAVPACPAPQTILLSPDETRMIVPCWRGEGARSSKVLTYRTDFSSRPWPKIEQEGEATVDGAVVAGTFSPTGDRVYLVDRTGNRLIEANPATLERLREIPTGDLPVDVAVVAVTSKARERAAGESRARQTLATLLERMRTAGRPFSTLSWTETATWNEPVPPPPGAAKDAKPQTVERTRRLRAFLAPPDRYRVETGEGGVRLAAGGDSISIDPAGRFWTAPRQELLSVVYNLPNLGVDDAIRQLAGDVPGSPWLRGGIAVDLIQEIEEEGSRWLLVGAARRDDKVSQLWIDLGTARPTAVVERFPVFQPRGHQQEAFPGVVETRFHGSAPGTGGVWLPARLERIVDGTDPQRVAISDARVNAPVADERFDLARLGGAPASPAIVRPATAQATSASGPGTAIPIQPYPYLKAPGEPHPPYGSSPPTSGPRLPFLADWGIHRVPVPLELQAHNLEHGGVLLQYNCPQGCPELVARLEALAHQYDSVLVAPYPWLDARLAVTAWGRLETLDAFDEARIRAFLDTYAGRDHHAEGGGTPGEEGAAPELRAAH